MNWRDDIYNIETLNIDIYINKTQRSKNLVK